MCNTIYTCEIVNISMVRDIQQLYTCDEVDSLMLACSKHELPDNRQRDRQTDTALSNLCLLMSFVKQLRVTA